MPELKNVLIDFAERRLEELLDSKRIPADLLASVRITLLTFKNKKKPKQDAYVDFIGVILKKDMLDKLIGKLENLPDKQVFHALQPEHRAKHIRVEPDAVDTLDDVNIPAVLANIVYFAPSVRKNLFRLIGTSKIKLYESINTEYDCCYVDESKSIVYWASRGTNISTLYGILEGIQTTYELAINDLESTERYAETETVLNKIKDRFKDKTVIACGHSLGARLVFEMYKTYPGAIDEVYLYAPATSFGHVNEGYNTSPGKSEMYKKVHAYIVNNDPIAILCAGEFPPGVLEKKRHVYSDTKQLVPWPESHLAINYIPNEVNDAIENRLPDSEKRKDVRDIISTGHFDVHAAPGSDLQIDIAVLKCLNLTQKAHKGYKLPFGTLKIDKTIKGCVVVSFISPDNEGTIYKEGISLPSSKGDEDIGPVNPSVWTRYKEFITKMDAILEELSNNNSNVIYTGHSLGGTFARWAALKYKPSRLVTCAEYASDNLAFKPTDRGIVYRHYFSKFDVYSRIPLRSTWDASRDNIPVDVFFSLSADLVRPSAFALSAIGRLWDLYESSSVKLALDTAAVALQSPTFISECHSFLYIYNKILEPDFVGKNDTPNTESWFYTTFFSQKQVAKDQTKPAAEEKKGLQKANVLAADLAKPPLDRNIYNRLIKATESDSKPHPGPTTLKEHDKPYIPVTYFN